MEAVFTEIFCKNNIFNDTEMGLELNIMFSNISLLAEKEGGKAFN